MSASNWMTWEEIRKRYANRWVVLVEQEWHADDDRQLHVARVLACGATRAEAVKQAYPVVKIFASYSCRHTGEPQPQPQPQPQPAADRSSPIEANHGDLSSGPEELAVRSERRSVDAMNAHERLTWRQICERYPQQWVVLFDHDPPGHELAQFKTARVLAVGNTRVEAKERARPQLDSSCEWDCYFTGPIRGSRFGDWP